MVRKGARAAVVYCAPLGAEDVSGISGRHVFVVDEANDTTRYGYY